METINLNTPKALYFTLYEKCSNITNPYFTFKITAKDSLKDYIFTANDFSYAPYYWNAFTFSMSTTQSGLTAGIVQAPYGEYTYEVYEMQNQYDLNINNAVKKVENGIWIINATYSKINMFTQSDTNTINIFKALDRI